MFKSILIWQWYREGKILKTRYSIYNTRPCREKNYKNSLSARILNVFIVQQQILLYGVRHEHNETFSIKLVFFLFLNLMLFIIYEVVFFSICTLLHTSRIASIVENSATNHFYSIQKFCRIHFYVINRLIIGSLILKFSCLGITRSINERGLASRGRVEVQTFFMPIKSRRFEN